MTTMIEQLQPMWKAVVGFLAPGILVLCVPLASGQVPTQADWLMALGAALTTGLAVYIVPNIPPASEPEAEADDYAPERADV